FTAFMPLLRMNASDLHFESAVRDAFSFLCSKFGFTCKQTSPIAVLYTAANAEVAITLDPQSYEVGVDVMQTAAKRSFPLYRIIELTSPTEAQRWRLVQTSTPERVQEFMPKLARLLERYGQFALAGDPKAFARMAEVEESEAMRTTRDLQIRQACRLADHEWHSRNYAEVVAILTPIQEELTNSQLAKFLYAKKHLQSQRNRQGEDEIGQN